MSAFAGTYNSSHTEIQPELLAGESLLWVGQPQKRVIFHSRDWFVIPFSLMWGGFAIFWEWGASGHFGKPAPDFFTLWGIPFVVMGQYMIWGRFIYTAWRKSRTHYGVTNKRAVILNAGSTRKVTDRNLANLDSMSLSVRSDGIGTIQFSSATIWNPGLWARGPGRNNQIDIDLSQPVFYDIEDARHVYELIQAQRQQRTAD
jgi:hypothetical protein